MPNNTVFNFDNVEIEIVKNFTYLGMVFSTGGSFSEAQSVLSGQALNAIFQMNKYLHKFTYLAVQLRLDLFEKLITPILNYGSQVWGFAQGTCIERVHLQFCKRLLGVKKCTQNDFVYGELGRMNCQYVRYFIIIRCWVKILHVNDNKYDKKTWITC